MPRATFAGNLFAALSADLTAEYADSVRGDVVAVAGDQLRVAADLGAVRGAIQVAIAQLANPFSGRIPDESAGNIKALTVASKTVARAVLELETGFSLIRIAAASSSTDPASAARVYQYGVDQVARGVADFFLDPNLGTAQSALSALDESFGVPVFQLPDGPARTGL